MRIENKTPESLLERIFCQTDAVTAPLMSRMGAGRHVVSFIPSKPPIHAREKHLNERYSRHRLKMQNQTLPQDAKPPLCVLCLARIDPPLWYSKILTTLFSKRKVTSSLEAFTVGSRLTAPRGC